MFSAVREVCKRPESSSSWTFSLPSPPLDATQKLAFAIVIAALHMLHHLESLRNTLSQANTKFYTHSLLNKHHSFLSPVTKFILQNTTPWRAIDHEIWEKPLLGKGKNVVAQECYRNRSTAKTFHGIDSVQELLNPTSYIYTHDSVNTFSTLRINVVL
ncbi:hypothetical protein TNCV_3554861 [Trichonephila clavipes]|nr:hypothetical protein TNCV_3554861 [Trichonephila clavipes]